MLSTNARTGGYALTTAASGSGANRSLTGLSPNTTYLLTGWAKVANAGENLAIGVKGFGSTETYTNIATTSYTQAAVVFTSGSANTTATVYCWKNSGGSGAGYCDDLAVEPLASAANAVTNPGYETGALTPRTQSTGTASGVVASNARTGTYALRRQELGRNRDLPAELDDVLRTAAHLLHHGRRHHLGRDLLLQELRLRGGPLRRPHPDQAPLTRRPIPGRKT
ncbi:hypothetical protein [Streptomyces sp. NPDC020951]|uniref:hypothetical protein n=1 Tax=Streptomyces sp. NPDC020951 TaxID=3365104 RepID=UPI00379DDD03